jgi:hypothetical protein
MTRAEKITVTVAIRALLGGMDPALVADFLREALLADDDTSRIDELLRPGGTA